MSSWWEQRPDGRYQVWLKDGTNILSLKPGKTFWLLPSQDEACRFLAATIESAEKRELDGFLTVLPKKKKQSFYAKYLADLKSQRRQQLSVAVLGDAAAMPENVNE